MYFWDATPVTDAGAACLTRLPRLHYIHISGAQLTDRPLHSFGGMRQLTGLSLQNNRFTDVGLAELKNLNQLESLWVDRTEPAERVPSKLPTPACNI